MVSIQFQQYKKFVHIASIIKREERFDIYFTDNPFLLILFYLNCVSSPFNKRQN